MAGWIVLPFPGGANTVAPHAIHFCPTYGKWVAVGRVYAGGGNDGIAFESSDGLNWTQLVTGFETGRTFRGVSGTDAVTNRGLVVIHAGSTLIEMDNAGVWTEVETGVGSHLTAYNTIAYLPGVGFCVFGSAFGNNVVWVSSDGVTWTGPSGGIPGSLDAQTVFKSRFGIDFIRIGNFGTFTISRSLNGTTWSDIDPAPSPTNGRQDITFKEGGIPYSLDATAGVSKIIRGNTSLDTWEELAEFNAIPPSEIAFSQLNYNSDIEKFVIISNERSFVSSDGITWEQINLPVVLQLARMYTATETIVFAEDNILVMKGDSGNPFSSFTEDPTITKPANLLPEANNPDNNLEVTLSFDTNNPIGEDVDGYAVLRTDPDGLTEFVGSVENDDLADTRTFIDIVPGPGTYIYTVFAYSITNGTVSESVVSAGLAVADIVMIGSGGIDFGGTASTVFILDPSGIYTLILNKRHDTLYERMSGIDSQNVKIPDPFIQTAFIGDSKDD